MKQANVIASVILAAAVLLAAYAIGRLIQQARVGDTAAPPVPTADLTDLDDVNEPEPVMPDRRIRRGREDLTPEEVARIREERATKLAELDNLTEEERAERLEAMRQQFRSRPRRGPGRVPHLTAEELADISKRWPEMSEEERAAFRSRLEGMRRLPSGMRQKETLAKKPSSAPTVDSPAADANAPDPNAADPNQ